MDPLLALLKDPDVGVRGAAVAALKQYNDPKTAEALNAAVDTLVAALKDPKLENAQRCGGDAGTDSGPAHGGPVACHPGRPRSAGAV